VIQSHDTFQQHKPIVVVRSLVGYIGEASVKDELRTVATRSVSTNECSSKQGNPSSGSPSDEIRFGVNCSSAYLLTTKFAPHIEAVGSTSGGTVVSRADDPAITNCNCSNVCSETSTALSVQPCHLHEQRRAVETLICRDSL